MNKNKLDKQNGYVINLHQMLLSEVGSMEDYQIKLHSYQENDFQIEEGEELTIQLTKIDEKGVSVFIPKQDINGIATDAVSLEKFPHAISTYPIERRYYTTIPEEEDPEMVEKVHTGNFEVDIAPIIDEAVFLNIPYKFHKDQQSKPQTFSTSNANQNSPFAKLKELSQKQKD
jgi:hypothetical protein